MGPTQPATTYYVVIFPQNRQVLESVEEIARLLKIDPKESKQKLKTKGFEILSRFAKKANAEGLCHQLKAFGVEAFIVSDHDIRSQMIVAQKTANAGEGGFAFRDFEDKPIFCPYNDVIAITSLSIDSDEGSPINMVDLHLRASNVSPRVYTELFDFAELVDKPNAGTREFFQFLEWKTNIHPDETFEKHRAEILAAVKGFGSNAVLLPPPQDRMKGEPDTVQLKAGNIFSILHSLHAKTRSV